MPGVVGESSTMPEHIRYRKPRNQPVSYADPNPPQIPSIVQSTRCKSTISSLLLSSFTTNTNVGDNTTTGTATNNAKKKSFTSSTFRGLGCTASSQVSVPAVIRTSANWEAKKTRKKKQRSMQQKKNKAPNQAFAMTTANASSSVVLPDVWCGPGIGFSTDAASVDCVVSRKPVSGRGKVDGEKMNQRERSTCPARRTMNPEHISFADSAHPLGMACPELDVFGGRYHRQVRHRSPEGLAEIMMLQSSLLMGGRSDGLDRYREWRLDVDNMSYEELLELGDRIGYVNTGLREDEILCCLRKTKLSVMDHLSSRILAEMERKCSICQEEYEAEDEMGKLDCGHLYHIQCIKQWLVQKNVCPICKTVAAAEGVNSSNL